MLQLLDLEFPRLAGAFSVFKVKVLFFTKSLFAILRVFSKNVTNHFSGFSGVLFFLEGKENAAPNMLLITGYPVFSFEIMLPATSICTVFCTVFWRRLCLINE